MEDKELLAAYRKLWIKRELLVEDDEEETLISAIEKDFMDEMTHPRLRKGKYEKYYLSIQRIIRSSLNDREKLELIAFHNRVFENLEDNK